MSHKAYFIKSILSNLIIKEYGLKSASSQENAGGVTLVYPKYLEGYAYADLGECVDALEQLCKLCSLVPVHVLFGEDQLKIPAYLSVFAHTISPCSTISSVKAVQEDLCNAAHGRRMASTVVLSKVGHTVSLNTWCVPLFLSTFVYRPHSRIQS